MMQRHCGRLWAVNVQHLRGVYVRNQHRTFCLHHAYNHTVVNPRCEKTRVLSDAWSRFLNVSTYCKCDTNSSPGKRDRFVENLSEKDAATLLAYYDLCSDDNDSSATPSMDTLDDTAADEYGDGTTIFECASTFDSSKRIRVVDYHKLLPEAEQNDMRTEIPGAVLRELQIFDVSKHDATTNVAPTQSLVDMGDPARLVLEYLCDAFACTTLRESELAPPQRVCVLGLGAGSAVTYCRSQFPWCDIDAVEIDKSIVDVAQEYFHLGAGGVEDSLLCPDPNAVDIIVGNAACNAALRTACKHVHSTHEDSPHNIKENTVDDCYKSGGFTRIFVQDARAFRESLVESIASSIEESCSLKYDMIIHDIDIDVADDVACGDNGLFSARAMQQWLSVLKNGGIFVCNYMAANAKDCTADVLHHRQQAIDASHQQLAGIFPHVYKVASTEHNMIIAGVASSGAASPNGRVTIASQHPLVIPELERRGVDMYLDGQMTAHVLAHVDLIHPYN